MPQEQYFVFFLIVHIFYCFFMVLISNEYLYLSLNTNRSTVQHNSFFPFLNLYECWGSEGKMSYRTAPPGADGVKGLAREPNLGGVAELGACLELSTLERVSG